MTDPASCPACRKPLPADAPGGLCPECLLLAGLATGGRPPSAAAALDAAEIERRLPQFEVKGVLGRGGMGVVWRARHRVLDRDVALKVLAPDAAAAAGFAERFRREAKALARLDHPNVVRVHDSGESDGLFWLAMELVEGTSLRHALAAGAVRPHEALAIVRQICDALEAAHAQGVVHRDIKPENVLLSRDGRVKVADFGIAKIAGAPHDEALTAAGGVVGTAHYMAPEQVERPRDVDHRADIYSLGVVFYELLTGELPIGRFEPPSAKVRIDVRLDEIVLRTLAKEREARYQRVAEVRTSVDAVGDGADPGAPDGAEPHWTRSWATTGLCVAFAAAMWALGVHTTHDGFAVPLAAWALAAAWTGVKARTTSPGPWRERTQRNRWAWAAAGAALVLVAFACTASHSWRVQRLYLPFAVPGALLVALASTWSPACAPDAARPRRSPLAVRAVVLLALSVAIELVTVVLLARAAPAEAQSIPLRAWPALFIASWILAVASIVQIVRSKGAWTGIGLAIACVVLPVAVPAILMWVRTP